MFWWSPVSPVRSCSILMTRDSTVTSRSSEHWCLICNIHISVGMRVPWVIRNITLPPFWGTKHFHFLDFSMPGKRKRTWLALFSTQDYLVMIMKIFVMMRLTLFIQNKEQISKVMNEKIFLNSLILADEYLTALANLGIFRWKHVHCEPGGHGVPPAGARDPVPGRRGALRQRGHPGLLHHQVCPGEGVTVIT